MYFDLEGTVKGRNISTGDEVEITFNPKSFRQKNSMLKGFVTDRKGVKRFEISGDWLNKMQILDLQT